MLSSVPNAAHRPLTAVEPQTFSQDADRERLTSVALTAFRTLSERWHLTAVDSAALVAVSPKTWERMRKPEWKTTLNQDQLTRISAMVGILKGLRLLFADELADQWPKLQNKGPLFGGRTPVESMVEGGIPRMLEVRRHVDALRGGL